jgi:hypothetical protein
MQYFAPIMKTNTHRPTKPKTRNNAIGMILCKADSTLRYVMRYVRLLLQRILA